jgi:hypothetical protein
MFSILIYETIYQNHDYTGGFLDRASRPGTLTVMVTGKWFYKSFHDSLRYFDIHRFKKQVQLVEKMVKVVYFFVNRSYFMQESKYYEADWALFILIKFNRLHRLFWSLNQIIIFMPLFIFWPDYLNLLLPKYMRKDFYNLFYF